MVTLPWPRCDLALSALENFQRFQIDDTFDERLLELVFLLLARLGARQDLLPGRDSIVEATPPMAGAPDIHQQRNAACIAIARLLIIAERCVGLLTGLKGNRADSIATNTKASSQKWQKA